MTEAPRLQRPQAGGDACPEVDPAAETLAGVDPRVSMVLAVMSGRPVDRVAAEWDVEPSLLHRWVGDFLVAGAGAVTNQPDPDALRQRDRFMVAMAHELRTPMAIARGWALTFADDHLSQERAELSLERLLRALDRLSEHIVDVELAASSSLGLLHVIYEPVRVDDLIDDLPDCSGVRAGADLVVHADPVLLRRVLRDLWTTARRSPEPDRVAVDVLEYGSWHEIRVTREGAPISPFVLRALFDPFDANDDATGVTLGLFVARALVVAHGGILGAEGDDHDTVLYARLPRPPATGPEHTGAVDDEGGDR